MPKIKYLSSAIPPYKPEARDELKALFNYYQKRRKLSAEDMGERLDKTAGAIRQKKARGTDTWTVEDVREWCKALGITDPAELGRAILGRN